MPAPDHAVRAYEIPFAWRDRRAPLAVTFTISVDGGEPVDRLRRISFKTSRARARVAESRNRFSAFSVNKLQQDHRVMITGPSTLAMLLNSPRCH